MPWPDMLAPQVHKPRQSQARRLSWLVVVLLLFLPVACLAGRPEPERSSERGGADDQVLRLASFEPAHLDPGLAEDAASVMILTQIFEGLVGVGSDGSIHGVHAERWDIGPDGRSYTFWLREGPRWSDGQPVTAHDYVYAWKRNVTESRYASSFYPIRNARPIHEGGADQDTLGVWAPDDRTLVVLLERPAVYFPHLVATWAFFPLPRAAIERYGVRWTEPGTIVSNGPFRLDSWRHDRDLVLNRNDDYWGRRPTLTRVEYTLFTGSAAALIAAYRRDEVDATLVPAESADEIRADERLQKELRSFSRSGTWLIVVNHRRPWLQDRRVRQALGMALDREQLAREVWRAPFRPATSLQPEGIIGRRPELWPTESITRARDLLAAAGYPDGRELPELSFAYSALGQHKLVGEYLQERWRQTLGVRVRLDVREQSAFLQWIHEPAWTMQGDLYWIEWTSDYEDSHNWYDTLWDSAADPGHLNGGWVNPAYDALVHRARGEAEPATRRALYEQAEGLLAHDYVHIPVLYDQAEMLVKPYVKNVTLARVMGHTSLATVSVESH